MKHLLKTTLLLLLLSFNFSCSQQLQMKTLSDAKKIELNKKEFVGKKLNYLLKNVNIEIQSVIPMPNKKVNEVNRLSFLFVPIDTYKKAYGTPLSKPTRLVVIFNQNWDFIGQRCYPNKNPQCAEWLPEDEKNLGDLIVYDIIVLGKN
ncbi:hypothetical protein [Bergeyella sp. RCAD1439]|uniref:hypothetical protein n=1 Tax=Bergeyella anatis TaxID=3113737 RepID=UPI002E180383|nr:hypothetical protein [Bergeyella sp. RCAD1439]